MRPTLVPCLIAVAMAGAAQATELTVSSPAFAGGRIAERCSAYGANHSPPVTWAGAPAGTKSFALVLDDPDAHGPAPFVHWLVWNIPPTARGLSEGLPTEASLAAPAGAVQGRNGTGHVGYFGPRPPSGVHHYRLRVMALDRPLALAGGSDHAALDAAAQGHVLARGELVGTYAAP